MVTRYDPALKWDNDDVDPEVEMAQGRIGDYVEFADYEILEAERDRLQEMIDDIRKII